MARMEVIEMTRFALCTAVHTEAARRIMQTDDLELLVENLPDEALVSERKVFEFYRSLRDDLGL